MLGRSVESDKGLLPPGRAVGLLDLELKVEFLQSNQPLPMGVICAVELLCLHLLVKLASTQPVLAYLWMDSAARAYCVATRMVSSGVRIID